MREGKGKRIMGKIFYRGSRGLRTPGPVLQMLLFGAFLLSPGTLFALDFTIRVFDPATKKTLPDVQVILIETKTKYFTDQSGSVKAQVPAPGFYTFRAIIPGGELIQPRLQVNSPGQTVTLYTREPEGGTEVAQDQTQVVGEGGLVVTGSREKQNLSRYEVRIDEVKRIPGQFGDALRGIETLPGVAPLPFAGPSTIVLRGANPDASTFLLDDLPMGYAFHFFANQVLHNDIIKSIDVYTGAYPVEYGNATGGVVHIHTIDEVDNFGGTTSYSLWSTSTMFQGKIGEDGYWFGAGRISYLHIILRPYIPDGIRPPFYWDGQFKAHYRLTPEQAIEFYAFGAKDTLAAEIEDKGTWDPVSEPDPIFVGASIALDQAFHTEAVRHIWTPTSKMKNELSLINHDNIFFIDGSIGIYDVRQNVHNGWIALKDEYNWELLEDHIYFDAGFEARNYQYKQDGQTLHVIDPNLKYPDFYDSVNPDFEVIPLEDSKNSLYNSGYSMLTLRGYGFEFKPGVRSDYFKLTGHWVTDPRGTLSYTVPGTGTVLMGGGGTYHRIPDPRQYSPSTGNPHLKMEKANHYAMGVEQRYRTWLFKMEGFRQYYDDIVVDDPYITTAARQKKIRNWKDIRNQRHIDEIQKDLKNPWTYNAPLGYSNDGSGMSEGIEVMIKRTLPSDKNGLYGWITYTWSRSVRNNHQHVITDYEKTLVLSADERRILNQQDNAKQTYADFDRTVMASFVLGYKMNREWQFGLRWDYRTATPYTPITGNEKGVRLDSGRVIFNPKYSTLTNSERLPPYHRLDVRVDHFVHYEWGYGNVFVEVLNVYMKENPEDLSWSTSRPFSETNPTANPSFSSLEFSNGNGTKTKVPLFNIGLEVKF